MPLFVFQKEAMPGGCLEVEWIAQAVDGGDFSDSSVYQGPCFTLVATSLKYET